MQAGAVLFRPGVLQPGRLRLHTAAEERREGTDPDPGGSEAVVENPLAL